MAWVTLGTVDLIDHSNRNYGHIHLQWDNSATTSTVPCRLYYDNTWGTSLSVTLRDITVLSVSVGNIDVGLQDKTLWSGNLAGGSVGTFHWYCNWYSGGYKYYESGSITIPNPAPVPPTPTFTPTLYGSVNGRARKVKKLYCSVNSQTRKIKKLYAGDANGNAKLIYEDS